MNVRMDSDSPATNKLMPSGASRIVPRRPSVTQRSTISGRQSAPLSMVTNLYAERLMILMTQMLLKCLKTGVAGRKNGFDELKQRLSNPYYPANGWRFRVGRSANEGAARTTTIRHFFHHADRVRSTSGRMANARSQGYFRE